MSWPAATKERGTPEQTLVHRPLMQLVEMHIESLTDLRGLIHVPNEGKRTRAGHAILVGLGMRAGVSDLLLLRARRGYRGLALELKAPGSIRAATPEQKSFLRQQRDEGWLGAVCDDAAAGWQLVRWYATGAYGETPERYPHGDDHLLWATAL